MALVFGTELDEFTVPSGWKSANMPDAVVSQAADNTGQLQLAQAQGTPAQAVQQFVGQQGIAVTQSAQTTINGLPASMAQFNSQTQDGGTRRLGPSSIEKMSRPDRPSF